MDQFHESGKILKKEKYILSKYAKHQQLIKEAKQNPSLYNFIEKSFLQLFKYTILFFILCLISLLYLMPTKIEEKYKEIEKYIKFNLEGNLEHSPNNFCKKENPEISIIVSTFNGEVYIKPAVRSVQNQNFLNIEIIIVDDGSMDNSIEVIKELMEEDRRIKFLCNGVNRGTLYTKTKGVLNAKGKYVMTLDQDNLYSNKNVFYNLYREAEQYNLDLLGFSTISSGVKLNLTKSYFLNYFRTHIVRKPNLKKRFLGYDSRIESGIYLCLYFIKTNLFLNAIKQLGDEFINRNIDAHDDTILMFILSRIAVSLKHLKEIYYILLQWPEKYFESLKFQRAVKLRERERKNCYSYLTLIEIVNKFTEDNEKFIAEKCLYIWFLSQEKCRNNTGIMNYAIRVLNFFLNDKHISSKTKKNINLYLNKTKQQK